MSFEVITIENRNICIIGIGRLFYESGFPISMSISNLKEKNIEVSILHVADECLKNGWSPKTTYNKLKVDFEEDIDKSNCYDITQLETFCYADYETQREMIFQYLFNTSTDSVRQGITTKPLDYIKANYIKC